MKTTPTIDLAELAYAMYKQDWIDTHTTPEMRLNAWRDYADYLQDCAKYGIQSESYDNWFEEVGFHGFIYACPDEFFNAEYQDAGYMERLLGNKELFALYKNEMEETDEEENEEAPVPASADVSVKKNQHSDAVFFS